MEQENNNSIIEYTNNNIEIKDLIFTIRGKQVMLDNDVAMLYHYETKRINEAVSRNKARFPEEFCFQLTEDELGIIKGKFESSTEQYYNLSEHISTSERQIMRSQFATASNK